MAFDQPAGVPFGYGQTVAFNNGKRPAVLERISPVGATPGLRVLGTYAGGPGRKYLYYTSSSRWPDRTRFSDLHPVVGFSVAPRSQRGVELVFKLVADRPGGYEFRRIAVDYRVGDTRHHVELRGPAVCVIPRGQPRIRGRCGTPTL